MMLSVLSVLIGWSTLQATLSVTQAWAEMDQFVIFPATLQDELKRERDNERNMSQYERQQQSCFPASLMLQLTLAH